MPHPLLLVIVATLALALSYAPALCLGDGHASLGPAVFFGYRTAMYGALSVRTRWGYVCFRLPIVRFGQVHGWYFYVSPNSTPWAARIGFGPGFELRDRVAMNERNRVRRALLEAVRTLSHEHLTGACVAVARGEAVGVVCPAGTIPAPVREG